MKAIFAALAVVLPSTAMGYPSFLQDFSFAGSQRVEHYVDCRFERKNCWHDFTFGMDARAFALEVSTPAFVVMSDLYFVCRDWDGRGENKIRVNIPKTLDDRDLLVTDPIANPCPGRLKRVAIRAHHLELDGANARIALWVR